MVTSLLTLLPARNRTRAPICRAADVMSARSSVRRNYIRRGVCTQLCQEKLYLQALLLSTY